MPTRLSGQCGASDLVAGGTHARGAGEEGAAVGRALRGAPPLHSEVGNGLSVPPPPGRPTGPPPCLLPHRARPQRRPPQVQGTHAIYIYIYHPRVSIYGCLFFRAGSGGSAAGVHAVPHRQLAAQHGPELHLLREQGTGAALLSVEFYWPVGGAAALFGC